MKANKQKQTNNTGASQTTGAGGKPLSREGNQKTQVPFRLSKELLAYIDDCATFAGVSTGKIGEDALWLGLPLLMELMVQRRKARSLVQDLIKTSLDAEATSAK